MLQVASVKKRHIQQKVIESLQQFPVVVIEGARQVGKSTLVKMICSDIEMHYCSLDDIRILQSASADPQGFIDNLQIPMAIDEVQRVPELLLAIKKRVDDNRKPGMFLLTGSARLDAIRKVRENLSGRSAILQLNPLTVLEISDQSDSNPLERLLSIKDVKAVIRSFTSSSEMFSSVDVIVGGFPEPSLMLNATQRSAWHEQFRLTYIERDVKNILSINDIPTFSKFVTLCASATANIFNNADAARDIGVSPDTVRRWLNIIELTFCAIRLQPYWANIRKRLVKMPKLMFCDSGIASNMLGIEDWNHAQAAGNAGKLLETWVYNQLLTLSQVCRKKTRVFYYRDHGGVEVDFIIESYGDLIPIEVKSSGNINSKDWKNISMVMETLRGKCRFGMLLYGGKDVYSLPNNIVAMPLTSFFRRG